MTFSIFTSSDELNKRIATTVANFFSILETHANDMNAVEWVDAETLVEILSEPDDPIAHTRLTLDIKVANINAANLLEKMEDSEGETETYYPSELDSDDPASGYRF